MTPSDILELRLRNQQLARHDFTRAAEVVSWMGAVQAQDYAGAKWALGLRLPGETDAGIERAFDRGEILRTHVLRPTWHFVVPADLRWMLELTAPRVRMRLAYYHGQLELDDAIFRKSNRAIENALRGGKHLTKGELTAALTRAGLAAEGQRLNHLLMRAELDGVTCSGPRLGKQFTYALIDERVPPAAQLDRDEATAELVLRYFTSHGPAQVKDFAWWSGLTVRDGNAGVDAMKSRLATDTVGGKTYWYARGAPAHQPATAHLAHLLPNYDEYGIGYTDRSAFLTTPAARSHFMRTRNHPHWLLIDGRVQGMWRRDVAKAGVSIELAPFERLRRHERAAVEEAARRYAAFIRLDVTIGFAP